MRILVQITSWNASRIIHEAVNAVLQQTLAVEEVLIVDNVSTDGTADLSYPKTVAVVQSLFNLGPAGAVTIGFEYARARGYDWMWVLDADSRPRPDTLELLAQLARTAAAGGLNVGVIAPSHNLLNLGRILRGRMLTPGGPRLPKLREDRNYVDCDSVIWSGALISLAVVERIGLPRMGTLGSWEDLSIDYGDIEYTYRVHRAGYKVLVHRDSYVDHRVGNGLHGRILGRDFYTTNHPAFRRYLYFRNLVFFWVKLYERRNWPVLLAWLGFRLGAVVAGIVLLESERRNKLRACFVGIRDGLLGRLNGRFEGSP